MIYYRIHMKMDTDTIADGTISEWGEYPAEGIPSFGMTPDQTPYIQATLEGLSEHGATSIQFDLIVCLIEFSLTPELVEVPSTP